MAYAGIERDALETAVHAILTEPNPDGELTKKAVRRKLEGRFGLDEGALDEHKEVVNEMVVAGIQRVQAAEASEDSASDSDSDSDSSDDAGGGGSAAASPAKAKAKAKPKAEPKAAKAKAKPKAKAKAKPAKATPSKRKRGDDVDDDVDDGEPKAKAKMTVKTISGSEAPKGAKAAQLNAMSGADFMASAPLLELDVFGNQLTGEPREFSSGKFGWYVGGKIEVNVGGQVLWGQVGCNLVMIGSEGW